MNSSKKLKRYTPKKKEEIETQIDSKIDLVLMRVFYAGVMNILYFFWIPIKILLTFLLLVILMVHNVEKGG